MDADNRERHVSPPPPSANYDRLSLSLAGLFWPHWRTIVIGFTSDQGIEVAAGSISFYAVRRGPIVLACQESEIQAETGDVILLPHASGHTIRQAGDAGPRAYHTCDALPPLNGGAANASELIAGHYVLPRPQVNPLRGNLPGFLHLSRASYPELSAFEPLLSQIRGEQQSANPGWQAISNQLIQVLFHQSLRIFMSRSNDVARTSGLPHAGDPPIDLVVGLLHAQPETAWTVASLARWVKMSRSAFSERFREVVGKPPLQYLTEVRMQRAQQLLTTTDLGVKQISTMVGYESPSSFTNAFKRRMGISPIGFRSPERDANGSRRGDH